MTLDLNKAAMLINKEDITKEVKGDVTTFTHTDGKSYTTETAAEQQARTTVPAGSNTAFQNAANAFTPSDGKEYVGGVLVGKDGKQTNSFYQNAFL